jgi:hypothetical protein
MIIHDGGSAFPVFPETETGHGAAFRGMTLRDYFAAKAMQGMFAADIDKGAIFITEKAKIAYEMADAMLKEREIQR